MSLLVSNIQRMSLDDGPGIRTTVFLQGCNLHCPWCSNPETQPMEGYPDWVPKPKKFDPEELIKVLIKDRLFWGIEGGVTFSGGEPLLQAEGIREVGSLLKTYNVHIAIETALYVSIDCIKRIEDIVDFWYVDLKFLVDDLAERIIGGNTKLYLSALSYLIDKEYNVHLRIPCCAESVLQNENLEKISIFCANYSELPIEIFSIHPLGLDKYQTLGLEIPNFRTVNNDQLHELKIKLENKGSAVDILMI